MLLHGGMLNDAHMDAFSFILSANDLPVAVSQPCVKQAAQGFEKLTLPAVQAIHCGWDHWVGIWTTLEEPAIFIDTFTTDIPHVVRKGLRDLLANPSDARITIRHLNTPRQVGIDCGYEVLARFQLLTQGIPIDEVASTRFKSDLLGHWLFDTLDSGVLRAPPVNPRRCLRMYRVPDAWVEKDVYVLAPVNLDVDLQPKPKGEIY